MSTTQPTQDVDLSVNLAGLTLANPVMTASGTSGYGCEYADFMDIAGLGAFVTKSITVKPRTGNPPPRVVETRAGMLNAIGLANIGLDQFVATKMDELASLGCPVIANVAGHGIDDYLTVCKALDACQPIQGIELNVSCPNVSDGMVFGTDPCALGELVAAVRQVVTRCVLIVKLSPNVTDITATAAAAIDAGADVLSLVNTFMGMAIDIEKRKPILANRTGGLSGPAIKPLAVQMVDRVYRTVARDRGVPLIGMGGIQTAADAIEFILAGATAVAIGTALFVDPTTPAKINQGIADYLQRHNIARLSDLVGRLAE